MQRAASTGGTAAAILLFLALAAPVDAADPSVACDAGKLALSAGRHEESLLLYQDCLESDGLGRETRLDAHFNAGRALRGLERYAEAAEHFARVVALIPDYAPATLELADALESAGKYEEALSALDAFDAAVPGARDGTLLEERGHVYVYLGRHEEAIAAFEAAVKEGVESHRLLLNRGFAFAALKRFEEAYADFEAAIALEPEDILGYTYYGYNLRLNDRYDEASAILSQALEIDPVSVEALIERGNLKLDQTELDGAIADFTRIIEIDPQYAMAFANRALARSYQKDFEGTLADAEAALSLAPRDTLALHLRAEQLNLRGRFEEAQRDLEIVVAIEPENADALHDLSISLFQLGHWDESLATLDRSIDVDPSTGRYYGTRGYVRLRLGGGVAALPDFDRALTDEPTNYEWHFNRAQALAWLGRQDEARRDIAGGFAVMSEEEKVWHSNEICWELLLLGRTQLAAPLCEQAVELAGDAPSLDSRAFLYWQLGQTEKAEADLARAQTVAKNRWFFEPRRRLGEFPNTLAQGLLMFLGYRPDAPDRGYTDRTRQAILAFQRDHGLDADGEVSPELTEALKAARP